MRSDIHHALQALDAKTRYLMTSIAANRHFKKSIEGLPGVVCEQQVIALAPACPTITEAVRTGAGLGGQRLLVLTNHSLFEVNASSRMTWSGLESIETPLTRIVALRSHSERLAVHAGLRKTRFLVIDRERSGGSGVERVELDVLTDQSFRSFSAALADRWQTAQTQAKAKAPEDAAPPPPPRPTSPPLSLADEIGKLAALRDAGALTPEEFAAMKAKLLA